MEHNHIIQHNAVYTAQTGPWSSPSTWVGGIVPPLDSAVAIVHNVLLDVNPITCGITILENASLKFNPTTNIVLKNCENIIVMGTLQMTPYDSSITHSIVFHDVDETLFVGGGMDILDSDVGIWVRDSGRLILEGSDKTAWTRLSLPAKKGEKTIALAMVPIGWKIGDEISIAPTTPITISSFYTGFDVRTIVAINGNLITLNSALTYDHPSLGIYTAEVMNLTRNVRIEGKENGRIHINMMVDVPINIRNVQLRWMGPRQIGADNYTDFVLGRYPIHIHMCGDSSNSSTIENVVVRDAGSHAFVPHASHGITFNKCISYNTFEDAFWWDTPPSDDWTNPVNNSNNISWMDCISAIVKCDPSFRGYRMSNFFLGSGIGNRIEGCVATGNQGSLGACGYHWPESSNYTDNVWGFDGNIAHNNRTDGIFVWENDPHNHMVSGFLAYRNGAYGIEQGAYTNGYKYMDCELLENKNSILLYSNPTPNGTPDEWGYIVSFVNIKTTTPLTITGHTLRGKGPTLFKDCSFSKVIMNETPKKNISALFDFVNCNLRPQDFSILSMETGSRIRVQDGSVAYQINDVGQVSSINLFFNVE